MNKAICLAGAILAGGKAKRLFGMTKANLLLPNGKTIIERLISELQATGITDIAIAANEEQSYQQHGLPILRDKIANQGPLSGIVTVLDHFRSTHQAVLFTPCDLPHIGKEELNKLIDALQHSNIVYAMTDSGAQPLCVAIKTSITTTIQKHLLANSLKIMDVWQQLNAKALYFANEQPFHNVNSLIDLKKIHNSTIWVITGAGHNVGKTTVALKLNHILPNSIYAKFGHGRSQTTKPENYFQDIKSLAKFISNNLAVKKHLIIESNKQEFLQLGDIKIYIDSNNTTKDIRPDASVLKSQANIKITRTTEQDSWRQELMEIPQIEYKKILAILNQQRNHLL